MCSNNAGLLLWILIALAASICGVAVSKSADDPLWQLPSREGLARFPAGGERSREGVAGSRGQQRGRFGGGRPNGARVPPNGRRKPPPRARTTTPPSYISLAVPPDVPIARQPLMSAHFDEETVSGQREPERLPLQWQQPLPPAQQPPPRAAMPSRQRELNDLEPQAGDVYPQLGGAQPTMDTPVPSTTLPLAPLPPIHSGLPISDDDGVIENLKMSGRDMRIVSCKTMVEAFIPPGNMETFIDLKCSIMGDIKNITLQYHGSNLPIVEHGGRVTMTVGPHSEGGVRFQRWRDVDLRVRRVTTFDRYSRQRLPTAPGADVSGRKLLGPGLYTLTAISQAGFRESARFFVTVRRGNANLN